jgi:hypothetical protein
MQLSNKKSRHEFEKNTFLQILYVAISGNSGRSLGPKFV